jgi:hypothetical protein
VGDSLLDIVVYADDLRHYGLEDPMEKGRYYPDEIIISTMEGYRAYELGDLSWKERSTILETNQIVKGVVMHELTHDYIYQISREMHEVDSVVVHPAYRTHIWIIRGYEKFGASFIEEGLCEYMVEKMGELIPPKEVYIPETREDLTDPENRYRVVYKYSSHMLKPFLDTTGFKAGVKILLHNPPPTYEEILEPDLFFSRLNRL